MKTKSKASSTTTVRPAATQTPTASPKPEAFIGIDDHKRYSVYHVLDPEGQDLATEGVKRKGSG